jgi:hypothetical protein
MERDRWGEKIELSDNMNALLGKGAEYGAKSIVNHKNYNFHDHPTWKLLSPKVSAYLTPSPASTAISPWAPSSSVFPSRHF